MTDKEYFDSVMKAGNRDAFTHWPRLSHKDVIEPDDVELDREGNITDMPLLRGKPCFGRPETFLRHGDRERVIRLNGRQMPSTNHQCRSCPLATWQSCKTVVEHRVQADRGMREAYAAWVKKSDPNAGKRNFVGQTGRLWGEFKRAIAARGPFSNANDDALAEEEVRNRRSEVDQWRTNKAKQRHKARERRKREQQLPSRQFIENAIRERDNRRDALEAALADPRNPRSFTRVPALKRAATAAITANAWVVRMILAQSGRPCGSGTVAARLVDCGLNEGVALATLKARMPNDFLRAEQCERLGIWQPFNPDRDLLDYGCPDDAEADALDAPITELDEILAELSWFPVPIAA